MNGGVIYKMGKVYGGHEVYKGVIEIITNFVSKIEKRVYQFARVIIVVRLYQRRGFGEKGLVVVVRNLKG